MKPQPLLKKALRIVCIQKSMTYDDVANVLGVTKNKLVHACHKKTDQLHRKIRKYLHDNLEIDVTPRIRAIINDMTFKEYCEANDISYQEFIYYDA